MSENIIVNGGIDIVYASSLNELKGEIADKLNEVSVKMSKQWGVDVRYLPARFLNCTLNKILYYKVNKLCKDCDDYCLCQYFELLRVYFMKYNYIVFPYVPYLGRISNKSMLQENMFIYGVKVKNVLFVNYFCFETEYENSAIYSALNNAYHEFLNTLPDDYIQKHILPYIPRDNFIEFVSSTNLYSKLLTIYGRKELIPKNEAMIRYICNNEETKCLLDALYNEDDTFQPPDMFRGLYRQMQWTMRELRVWNKE